MVYHGLMKSTLKIGRHHFAFLRAIAAGLDRVESAKRYLGIDHGHEAVTASRNVIQAVRAIAKRNTESSIWRLIGLTIRPKFLSTSPTIDEYIAQNNLDDWSESEVLEMFKEAFPQDNQKANIHRERLRVKQVELLDKLELLSVEIPQPTDMVSGWFDAELSKKFITGGIITIQQLNQAINRGGVWYASLPGIGTGKVQRIESFLRSIGGRVDTGQSFSLIESHAVINDSIQTSTLNASTDNQAIESWIGARAGSIKTATVYKREAIRLMLWLEGKPFRSMKVEDCLAYMTFLQHIPDNWISRKHAKPFTEGWAPFRGQLSHDSQKQSVVIVAALFHFLHQASFISNDPWSLVNKKTGDDNSKVVKESRAISEFGFSEIIRYIENQPITMGSERIRFIFKFLESVGLRSMELLTARLEHFQEEPEGLILFVHGKGARNRYVFIPDQGKNALDRYLTFRGCALDSTLPLICSTTTDDPLGYQAFYQTVKSWTVRAIRHSELSDRERNRLEACSPHWLRHTFGTRAISRDVPMDVIQAQMGHASIQTTMNIYGRSPIKRIAIEMDKAFK